MKTKKVFQFLSSIFRFKNIVILLVFLGIASSTFYFYKQNQKNLELLNNPEQASKEEASALAERIGALIDLPVDEEPTVISVVDKEKVKDQPFFSKAENGDKVLVYAASKKAILYRPSTNKIIEVGPVAIDPETNFKIAIYNTTTDVEAIQTTEDRLKKEVTNLSFPIKEHSTVNIDQTLVVDLNGNKKTEADQLAKLLDGTVSKLPAGALKPEADFAIFVAE